MGSRTTSTTIIFDLKARCPHYRANPPIADFAGSISHTVCPQYKRSFAPESGHFLQALYARGFGRYQSSGVVVIGLSWDHVEGANMKGNKVLCYPSTISTWKIRRVTLPYVSHALGGRKPILDFQVLFPLSSTLEHPKFVCEDNKYRFYADVHGYGGIRTLF